MGIFKRLKNKYNKNPRCNEPRMVYGTPKSMRKKLEEKEKYDIRPEENAPQKVYGVPFLKNNEE